MKAIFAPSRDHTGPQLFAEVVSVAMVPSARFNTRISGTSSHGKYGALGSAGPVNTILDPSGDHLAATPFATRASDPSTTMPMVQTSSKLPPLPRHWS